MRLADQGAGVSRCRAATPIGPSGAKARRTGATIVVVLLGALATLALSEAPARAADADVKRAFLSNDPEFARRGRVFRRELREFQQRGYKRPGPVLTAIRKTRKLIAETRAAVEAEESSSEKGAEARTLAIESLDLFDRSQGATRRGTNALAQGKRKAGFRLFDTADELFEQAGRKSRRAEKLLNQAT